MYHQDIQFSSNPVSTANKQFSFIFVISAFSCLLERQDFVRGKCLWEGGPNTRELKFIRNKESHLSAVTSRFCSGSVESFSHC